MNLEELKKYLSSKSYVPSTTKYISEKLGVNPEEIVDLIQQFEEEGFIYRTKSGKWHRVGSNEMVGIIKFTRSGKKAFVTSNGKEALVEVADTLWALNGDKVLVEVFDAEDDILHGRVSKIIERSMDRIVGVYRSPWTNSGYVIPDDSKIIYEFRVYSKDSIEVFDGDKVVAKIIHYPDSNSEGIVEIVEKIGRADSPRSDLPSIIEKYKLPKPEEFPKSVRKAVKSLPKMVTEADMAGRKDFRSKHVFTIDGEDAKDFDDAVSIEKLSNGNYLLGVHIADVSNYVREGDPIDKEAFKRGTSVYLIDTVIPMLPFELSNDLCSLVQSNRNKI